MPAVTLHDLWIHVAADPATFLTFDSGNEQAITQRHGQRRMMASGRVRSIASAGVLRGVPWSVPFVSRAAHQTLEGWVSAHTLLMLRDAKSRVMWGHIYALTVAETTTSMANLSFTFEPITYIEEV